MGLQNADTQAPLPSPHTREVLAHGDAAVLQTAMQRPEKEAIKGIKLAAEGVDVGASETANLMVLELFSRMSLSCSPPIPSFPPIREKGGYLAGFSREKVIIENRR